MKLRTITKTLLCLSLLLCCGSFAPPVQQAAAAGPEIEEVRFVFHTVSWGMVRGQTARFNVGNLNDLNSRGPMSATVGCSVALYDAHGNTIAESEQIEIPPGQFRSIDFNRDSLELTGEPDTGRVQTRGEIKVFVHVIHDSSSNADFPSSIELVDSTGHTTLLMSKPKEIVVVGSK